MIISFIGHSKLTLHNKIKNITKRIILEFASHNELITCYLGGYGDFDEICASACRELKEGGKDIELVYVTPYITLNEQAKIRTMIDMKLYDASMYPPIEGVPPKFAILKRNEWMMEEADLIIACVKRTSGGAYKSLKKAISKKKKIINVCDYIQP